MLNTRFIAINKLVTVPTLIEHIILLYLINQQQNYKFYVEFE